MIELLGPSKLGAAMFFSCFGCCYLGVYLFADSKANHISLLELENHVFVWSKCLPKRQHASCRISTSVSDFVREVSAASSMTYTSISASSISARSSAWLERKYLKFLFVGNPTDLCWFTGWISEIKQMFEQCSSKSALGQPVSQFPPHGDLPTTNCLPAPHMRVLLEDFHSFHLEWFAKCQIISAVPTQVLIWNLACFVYACMVHRQKPSFQRCRKYDTEGRPSVLKVRDEAILYRITKGSKNGCTVMGLREVFRALAFPLVKTCRAVSSCFVHFWQCVPLSWPCFPGDLRNYFGWSSWLSVTFGKDQGLQHCSVNDFSHCFLWRMVCLCNANCIFVNNHNLKWSLMFCVADLVLWQDHYICYIMVYTRHTIGWSQDQSPGEQFQSAFDTGESPS